MKAIFFAIALFNGSAFAFSICDKGKTSNDIEYSYCISRATGSTSRDVIYYMHGAGGDETSWDHTGIAEKLGGTWSELHYQTPIAITVSFGPQWLLADAAAEGIQPAYLPVFLDEIMPSLEKKIDVRIERRMLMGLSMGGYNGAELALRASSRFDRVALLCPGLAVINPFSTDQEIEKFISEQPKTTKADYVWGVIKWVRQAFLNKDIWDRHDPLALATRSKGLKPSFFISCSKDDEYGFYNGAQTFQKVLNRKASAEFYSIEEGGHCAQTPESYEALATFIALGKTKLAPGFCMSGPKCAGSAYHMADKAQCDKKVFKSFKPDNKKCEDL